MLTTLIQISCLLTCLITTQASFLKSETQVSTKGLDITAVGKKSQIKIGLTKTPSTISYEDKRPQMRRAKTKTVKRSNGATAEITLKNKDNFDYLGEFYVGSQKQVMRGCFDTGSANAWILSKECDTEKCQLSKELNENYFFDSSESSTYVDLNRQATIMFGSGQLKGHFGKDSFTIGFGPGEIAIQNQTLGLITELGFIDPSYDAIIGLAYPAMSDNGLPIMDSMMQEGLLQRNIFAFYMAMNKEDSSELVFGDYDTDKFVGQINWHPVIDKLFWSLRLDDIKYKGRNLNICKDRVCMVTPDSGTSLITTPSWAIKIIQQELPYEEGCTDDLNYGDLAFVIDGIDYQIPSHHFMERYYNVFEEGDSVCMTNLSELDIFQDGQRNLFILGDAFMQIYYTIFDRDNDRVGFARARVNRQEETHDFDLAQQGNLSDFM